MGNNKINNILIPSVSKLPKHRNIDVSEKLSDKAVGEEFKNLLQDEIKEEGEPAEGPVQEESVKISLHAAKRLRERNLAMDSEEFFKIKNAIEKLRTKGGQDSLILTNKAAYIVDVNQNTIVTAMERENLGENVFTKIDSTLVID